MTVLARLESGEVTSRDLVETALRRIGHPQGQGRVAYRQVYRERALEAAERCDAIRAGGGGRALTGVPISFKDLFDVPGEVTLAGSTVLKSAQAATRYAAALERLLAQQAVLMGRTNMTEFAFSGLGLNPHYGTPLSPWRRQEERIAGGSTSGGAVSVAEGMALAALGSDTGGSVRIPATFCGLTGFKPTARRISTRGAFPLSWTLDCVGVIAPTVNCCRLLDGVLSAQEKEQKRAGELSRLRIGIPTCLVMEGLDPEVERTFAAALERLDQAGVRVEEVALQMLHEIPRHYRQGGLLAIEAYAAHRTLLERSRHEYDPRVAVRIETGRGRLAADYLDLLRQRQAFIERLERECSGFHLLAWPTVAVLPPRLNDLQDDEVYFSTNVIVLRNTSVANFLDRPALSIPLRGRHGAPVGFMLSAPAMDDRRLLDLGCALEPALRSEGA
ncbi:MAG TPA: amidase [Acidobacteriota bacterium]|nr:amidase [Acidobacteriota bacterium]